MILSLVIVAMFIGVLAGAALLVAMVAESDTELALRDDDGPPPVHRRDDAASPFP